MIRWYKNLYVGDTAKKKLNKWKKKIEKRTPVPQVVLLTYPMTEQNQLDLIPASMLQQDLIFDHLPEIVGIASNHAEAVALVAAIAGEVYQNTGDCRIRQYLEEHK